jgi:hypothetical protein
MKRKEGVFVVAQAAIVVAVLALVALPLQVPDDASLDVRLTDKNAAIA